MISSFESIKEQCEGKFQSRGSKFLGYVFPMKALHALEEMIGSLKQEHIKARHFCYAYRILEGDEITEYGSDAGEPSGSAGAPILAELKSRELLNVGSVVVRYFGGTKLGVPGLIEAYRTATADALDHGSRVWHDRVILHSLNMPMALQPFLLNACKKSGYETIEPEYTHRFMVTVAIPADQGMHGLARLLRMMSDRDYDEIDDQAAYLDVQLKDLGETISERP